MKKQVFEILAGYSGVITPHFRGILLGSSREIKG